MSYVVYYLNVGYAAHDARDEGAAGGYRFVTSPSQALEFKTQALAADFLEVSGPKWARDMATKGLLTIKEKP